ncbi:MAG: FapA family protein, partial [bacterium]
MADTKKGSGSSSEDILKELDSFDKKFGDSKKPPSDMPIAIRVSPDEMKVYVTVQPPLDSAVEIDAGKVMEELKTVGVIYGVDEDAVKEIFTYGSYNVEVIIAKGIAPSDGTSASIEYKFNTSADKKVELKADEQGNVDHRAMNLVESVEEGALLAVKVPSIPGQEGMTCLGKKLPAKEGRDVAMPLGDNVKLTDDGLGVLAAISGQPTLRDGKIAVSAVYEVKGDVSYKTGNVNFKGTVVITGNVLSDFVVSATEDVEINGNIEKAKIEAGGDVRVKGGLYGLGDGRIVAGGSITIRSVESGILEANADIILQQSARSSVLMAGNDIILNNPKGSITGGRSV